MSDTANAERAREFYEAAADGDVEAIAGVLAADVEWTEAAGLPNGGTYHGFDAVAEEVFAASAETWEEMTAEVDRLVSEGDSVVGVGVYRGTHATTGNDLEAPFAHVMDFDDGQITRFDQITDTVLHREAMGE